MADGSDCPSEKIQYTREGADDAVKRLRRGGDSTARRYRCDLCATFHVGHLRKIQSRRARGSRR